MSAAFVQHLNILNTLVEMNMSMLHTAVRFSSQSGFLRDRIVNSSDTSILHLSSTKDNWFLWIPTHALGKSLSLFMSEFFHLSNACDNEYLSHRTGMSIKWDMEYKRLCKSSSAVQVQCFNNNNNNNNNLLKVNVAFVSVAAFLP